jgi:CRP-like cAMP-binding protein
MKRAAASPAFTPRRHDRERRSHRSSHMEPQTLVALLAISAVFGSLAASDRDAIASCMLRMHFEPGHVIFSRGDLAREMYLVLEGKVRLSVLTSDARELSFAHAGPGNIFGEIAALDGGERTASATAINRVQVMALPQRAILDREQPHTGRRGHPLSVHAAARDRPAARGDRTPPYRGQAFPTAAVGAEVAVDDRHRRGRASRPRHVTRRACAADRRQPAQGHQCPQHSRRHGAIARKDRTLGKLMCNTHMLQEIAEAE